MNVLKPRQLQAIEALLSSDTVPSAAKACGVPVRTLYNWLEEPAFIAALRRAENRVIDEAARRLARVTGKAIAALEAVLDDPASHPGVRVRAALGILEQTLKVRSARDLDERLSALEEAIDELTNNPRA